MRSTFDLNDGHFNGEIKKTKLSFDSFSWYKELSLFYDIKLAPMTPQWPHFQWLSPSSQERVRKCKRFYVAFLYSKSPKYISHAFVRERIKEQGGQWQLISSFVQSLKMHPDYESTSLRAYRVRGLCLAQAAKEVVLAIPGYPVVNITP